MSEGQKPQFGTAAELCLYLIMCLPEEQERIQRIGDFCKLYDIVEKRPNDPVSTIGKIIQRQ